MTECGLPNLSEVHGLPVLESTPDELEQYDLVIDGTGLTAAIVACAASRSGKSVLHIDSNNYYGGSSGSFPLEDFQIWCRAAMSETLLSETSAANKAIEGEQHQSIERFRPFIHLFLDVNHSAEISTLNLPQKVLTVQANSSQFILVLRCFASSALKKTVSKYFPLNLYIVHFDLKACSLISRTILCLQDSKPFLFLHYN